MVIKPQLMRIPRSGIPAKIPARENLPQAWSLQPQAWKIPIFTGSACFYLLVLIAVYCGIWKNWEVRSVLGSKEPSLPPLCNPNALIIRVNPFKSNSFLYLLVRWHKEPKMPSGSLISQFNGTIVASPGGSIPFLGSKNCKPGELRVEGTRSKNSI